MRHALPDWIWLILAAASLLGGVYIDTRRILRRRDSERAAHYPTHRRRP